MAAGREKQTCESSGWGHYGSAHLFITGCSLVDEAPVFPLVSKATAAVDVLLGEEVPVWAAVLQGDAVASGAHAVARHRQRAVVVG